MTNTLIKLSEIIESRRSGSPDTSYVAKLFDRGTGKICQKIGEESAEVIVAALTEKKKNIINESADLLFHLSVLWVERGIEVQQVMDELEGRMGQSGLDEKAARRAEKKKK